MTRFAPVSPLIGLHELVKARELGTYQLLIAPIVLGHDWGYGQFFADHTDQTVILDNGLIELGYPVDPLDLARAAKIVRADVVVMPDTIDDGRYTAKQARHAMAAFRRVDATTNTMGVVQGRSLEECLECADALVKTGVDWLAVPRGLTPNLGSRVPLVQLLASEHGLPMHVLGFSDNLLDDIEAAACHRLVQGIDAATPVWAQQWFPPVAPVDPKFSLGLGKRPANFWTSPAVSAFAPANVTTVRQWLSDAVAARTAREGLAVHQDHQTHP